LLQQYKGIVGQGYLLGRPLPAETAARLLADCKAKAAVPA